MFTAPKITALIRASTWSTTLEAASQVSPVSIAGCRSHWAIRMTEESLNIGWTKHEHFAYVGSQRIITIHVENQIMISITVDSGATFLMTSYDHSISRRLKWVSEVSLVFLGPIPKWPLSSASPRWKVWHLGVPCHVHAVESPSWPMICQIHVKFWRNPFQPEIWECLKMWYKYVYIIIIYIYYIYYTYYIYTHNIYIIIQYTWYPQWWSCF